MFDFWFGSIFVNCCDWPALIFGLAAMLNNGFVVQVRILVWLNFLNNGLLGQVRIQVLLNFLNNGLVG